MILLSLLALLLIGGCVALVARAMALPDIKSADRIRGIELYGFHPPTPAAAPAAAKGPALGELAAAIGGLVSRRLRGVRPDDLRRELVAAGLYRLSPAALVGYRVLGLIVVGVAGLLIASDLPFAPGLAVAGVCAAMGWLTPLVFVRRTARYRLQRVERDMPDLIDLLVVTVEAGTGLAGSLQLAATKLDGPLADELKLTLQEVRMGRSLPEALMGMLGRVDTHNMRAFVRSITQGETLGVSIGTIMRNLAGEMRNRRRSAAQERAQKAPVKMLFPLVLLILPAFILTVLGPAMFELSRSLVF